MRVARLPAAWLTLLFAFLTLGPLVALASLSIDRSGQAVEEEARARLASTALVTGALVQAELSGLAAIVDSYAGRPALHATLAQPRSPARTRALRRHLAQLRAQRSGITVAFAADPNGRLLDILPSTPGIVGADFSFRDWYRGVTRTGKAYVSTAYVSAASNGPRIVAAAAPVRTGTPGRTVAILVAGLDLDYLQEFADRLAHEQGVTLRVTDQAGTVVATPGHPPSRLISLAGDPEVAAALRGESGTATSTGHHHVLAYAPVPKLGWTVTASVPHSVAFARVEGVRNAVAAIAGLLALVLVAGITLLAVTLRKREQAEARERAALATATLRNEELEAQTEALGETQRQLERALAEARRLAEINGAVLDATTDAIRMVDLEGRTLVVNRAMRELFASLLRVDHPQTIWGLTETIADRTADPAGYRAAMNALRDDPEREAVDEYELVDDGRWFQRYSAPVRNQDGGTVGRIFVLRDVTRERQADRTKSELVATVSHELRTPLTGVLGFAELLALDDVDEETRREYLRTIVGEAERLRTLINDFLDLQGIEEGQLTVALEPVELNDLIAGQARLYGAQSAAHTIELDLADQLRVLGDRDRIVQMLGNLLSNAVKYSPAGGCIRLTARRVGAAVRIEVSDPGIGIPEEQQARIFEKFFRADSTDTRQIGGTGLGLALVRELAEAHGGRAGFESVQGKGSTFWIELPRVLRPDSVEPRAPFALAVGDDPGMAGLLHRHLDELGYESELCASAADALERIARRRPDVVLLDIAQTGRMDGWALLTRLHGDPTTASLPVLVCSGAEQRSRAEALGAAGFLDRPFTRDDLDAELKAVARLELASVLVVDDEETVRNLVAVALEREPVEVREARDGLEAIERIEERRPDAMVLDLHLPKLDGLGVLERLRTEPAGTPIPTVVLTAVALGPAQAAALRSQGVWVLAKGAYSAHELRRLVREAIAA